jgi:nitroreductase
MNLDKAIKKRASIKKYSEKRVKIEKILEAIGAANHAPAPGNLAALRYIIVQDQETKDQIAEACRQEFVKNAPYIIVICSDPKKIKIMYDVRADTYIKQHAGAAIENFLLKITDLGLASCWVGAFSELILRDRLKIPENIRIEAILPVGYQETLDKTKQKEKPSLFNRLYFDQYKQKLPKSEVILRREDI